MPHPQPHHDHTHCTPHDHTHPYRCELPPEQHNILRVELFKHLASSSSGHALVLSQLCRALVGVAFQTMPEQWPNTVVSCIHSLKKACQEFQVQRGVALHEGHGFVMRRALGAMAV